MKTETLIISLYLAICSGWFVNAYKITQLDFEPSYKAEVVRVLGLFTPVSLITGWVTFEEEE